MNHFMVVPLRSIDKQKCGSLFSIFQNYVIGRLHLFGIPACLTIAKNSVLQPVGCDPNEIVKTFFGKEGCHGKACARGRLGTNPSLLNIR